MNGREEHSQELYALTTPRTQRGKGGKLFANTEGHKSSRSTDGFG